jgi:conjugal transfer/type IV secretion protein DotA/TraY
MNTQINTMRTTTNPQLVMDAETLKRGWGGAGLWFDKVMVFNGAMVDALAATPTPTQYPIIMEFVALKKKQNSPNIPVKEIYSPVMPETKNGKTMEQLFAEEGMTDADMAIAKVLHQTYQQIQDSEATTKPKASKTDNPAKNFVKLLFAESGIFDFRANSEVFPLAKLAMLGRDMINKTVIMLGTKALMEGAGGVVGADLGPIGDAIKSFGPGIGSFATIGLSVGILLYYFLPMMPFIYFFFAVGRWVKSIFEAMVAMPLWALAHIRLGGDGIPGPAAGQGYFLLLEIFLRPIFTLFGLMASIATFVALTAGLDSVFNILVLNVGGYDMSSIAAGIADPQKDSMREPLDALFYTAVYAMLVYIIATSSFKLIDILPNAVMRWGGTNTASFNDQTDPIGQVNYNMVYKADAIARQLSKEGDNFSDLARQRDMMKPTKS